MIRKPISADSHITEPPNCYVDYIDPAFRDRAPVIKQLPRRRRRLRDRGHGDAGAAGPAGGGRQGAVEDHHRRRRVRGPVAQRLGPEVPVADQDLDGVAAEMIYPTVGMLMCNHADFDFKKACFEAYNRWLAEYCAEAPDRLHGLAQVSMRTPEDGVAELKAVKAMGFKGVMMPGDPAVEDYDSKIYDPVWATAVELGLPLSFHILTTKSGALAQNPRGPADQRLPVDHPRLPGHHGHADLQRRVRPPSGAEGGLRRGRCRLGTALHVPHGPRLQAPPLLDEGAAARAPAERIFLRAHLRRRSRTTGWRSRPSTWSTRAG